VSIHQRRCELAGASTPFHLILRRKIRWNGVLVIEHSESELDACGHSGRGFAEGLTSLAVAAPFFGAAAARSAAESQPGCSDWNQPTGADFGAIVGNRLSGVPQPRSNRCRDKDRPQNDRRGAGT